MNREDIEYECKLKSHAKQSVHEKSFHFPKGSRSHCFGNEGNCWKKKGLYNCLKIGILSLGHFQVEQQSSLKI